MESNCPFCGGKPTLSTITADNGETHYNIRCLSCAAEGGWAKTPGNATRWWNMRQKGTIAVAGGCLCGIGYIEIPESIDSGMTVTCIQCQEKMVFDISTPEERAKYYAKRSED